MAKKVFGIGILPSGRAVRVLPLDAKRMLELTRRVGKIFPPAKPGETPVLPNQADLTVETQKAMVAMCVRGITQAPVEIKQKKRPPTEQEIENARIAGVPAPVDVSVVDFDATLEGLKSPSDSRWTALGEMQLENEDEDNELGMFELFRSPREWKAVCDIIGQAGDGGVSDNPFAGKMLKTSAG